MMTKATLHVPGLKVGVPLAADALPRDLAPPDGPPGELTRGRIATRQLNRHEWWLPDLARALRMSTNKLRDWALRGWVRSRQVPPRGEWIIWADGKERQRLRKLEAASKRGKAGKAAPSRKKITR
jgi:hypothetical protein